MKNFYAFTFFLVGIFSIFTNAFAQEKPMLPSVDTSKIEELLDGKSIIKYPHPRDVARFGDVVLKVDFRSRTVTGSNKTGSTRPGIIVLASGNTMCAGMAEFGYSCYVFEKSNGKIYITFPAEKNTEEWKKTEVRVE
jgi:hypothetical protein